MARIEEKSVTQPQTTPPDNLPKERPSERLKVVGIGASAGGVEALQSFFSALPASTGLAFVVVTHLDPERESILGELLQAHTTMPVRQVHSEEVLLQPDHVYVNAPAQRLLVTGAHLTAHEFDEPHNWHMPIDSFFRSLASAPNDAIAILLSGGGADGTLGMKSIKEAGGFLMVQDPNEARQDSMPRSAITTGLVDLVGSVSELAQKLIDLHQCPPRQPTANDTVNSQEVDLEENAPPWQMWEKVAPPGILVDADHKVIYLSETAGEYLKTPTGRLTTNLLRLARPELQAALRSALFDAFDQNRTTVNGPIQVDFDGNRTVYIYVCPRLHTDGSPLALVTFLKDEGTWTGSSAEDEEGTTPGDAQDVWRERQWRMSEERLQVMAEKYEITNEELRVANEELQSTNEEYRSTAEELETSKEELQLINEKLVTVNNELQEKVHEISQAHNDLENLLAATDIATIFLDRSLCIQRITPPFERIFNIVAGDKGRPISHFNLPLKFPELNSDARQVMETLLPLEREVSGHTGVWYLVRIHPYRSHQNKIEGVVVTFVDVTGIKATEEMLRQTQEKLDVALNAAQMGVWDLNLETEKAWVDLRHAQIFGYVEPIPDWGPATFRERILPEDRAKFEAGLNQALESGELDLEVRVRWPDGSVHWIHDVGQVYYNKEGKPIRAAGVTLNITERKEALVAEMRQHILHGQEMERTQLAHEIHDGPVQDLAALTFELAAIAKKLEDESLQTALAVTSAKIERNIRLLRHIMVTLRPPAVVAFGLASAMEHYIEEFRQQQPGVAIELTLDKAIPDLPEEMILALYRIYQQALYNIIQHAEAGHVWVRLARQGDLLLLEVEDDGVGFVVPEHPINLTRRHHLGIVGMTERARAIGGHLEVRSTPGQGTQVQVVVPLPNT
jgi:two-component system, chemotaxis family, CheB/CheR fusion protein